MSAEHMYVAAYWGDRAEPPDSAATRVSTMIALLAPLGRGFTDWVAGRDRALPSGDALTAWFEKAYDTKTTKRQPDIGAHVSFLSGRGLDSRALEVQLTVGLHAGMPDVLGNAIVMNPSTDEREDVLSVAPVEVVLALVRAWEPDWAVATNATIRNVVSEALDRRGRTVKPGAVTWLADRLATPQVRKVLLDLGAQQQAGGWLVDCRDAHGQMTPEAVLAVARPLVAAGL